MHEGEPWAPQPEPSGAEMAARGIKGIVRTPFELAGRAVAAATRPGESLESAREALEGLGEVAWAGLNPAPDVPLNVPIGPHRRLVLVRAELDDFKLVKNTFGGTVNDVVLTVVSGALRRWLRSRGVRTEGLELRALVPVSIRAKERAQHARQPDRGDARAAARLRRRPGRPPARRAPGDGRPEGLKAGGRRRGAHRACRTSRRRRVLAQASRLNFSTRLFNLIVTNVPGPQFPLYLLGRELLDLFPVAFLPKDHALAIAIMSYNGGMDFGLLGDYDAMADLESVGDELERALAELVEAAQTRQGTNGRGSVRRRDAAAADVAGQ